MVPMPLLFATLGGLLTVGAFWAITWRSRLWYVGPAVGLSATALFCLWRPLPLLAVLVLAAVFAGINATLEQWESKGDRRWQFALTFFAVCIGGLSNGTGSPGHFPEELAAWLHTSPEQAWGIVVAARKVIHFTAYGISALAAYRWSEANRSPGLWRGLAFVLPLALFDEFRQSFAAGRLGSGWDVALDMAGAVTFLFAAWLVSRSRNAPPTE
ncbi:MAG: VanZ family protein [Armatimonadetes bacterium]|nr:VanZ family protein [Armatimonadota bacterium]